MNKKAIAAFAAGATLLAGFAMATPAMAAANPCEGQSKAFCTVRVENAQKDYNAAETAYNTAKANYESALNSYGELTAKVAQLTAAAKTAADTYSKDAAAYGTAKAAYNAEQDNSKKAAKKIVMDEAYNKSVLSLAAKINADNALTAAKADLAKNPNVADLLNKMNTAKTALDQAKTDLDQAKADFLAKYPAPKPLTFEEQQKQAIADVYAAAQTVDQTKNDFAHTHEAFVDAAKKLKAAKSELAEAQAKLDAAEDALEDFKASGVKDEAKLERLTDAVARATANLKRVHDVVLVKKALPAYKDAKKANDKAQNAYNAAVEAYKAAYNHAVELNVNPDLLPKITLVDPTSDAFPELSEAKKIYDDALSGKFGAAAQKAVQTAKAKAEAGKNAPAAANGAAAAAAGKAGAAAGAAKGELSTKGGHGTGKAGEKLGNAGVGVALTALAASMLAGMGAAVRKMRH